MCVEHTLLYKGFFHKTVDAMLAQIQVQSQCNLGKVEMAKRYFCKTNVVLFHVVVTAIRLQFDINLTSI